MRAVLHKTVSIVGPDGDAVHYPVKPFGFGQLRDRLESYRDLHRRISSIGSGSDADQEQWPEN